MFCIIPITNFKINCSYSYNILFSSLYKGCQSRNSAIVEDICFHMCWQLNVFLKKEKISHRIMYVHTMYIIRSIETTWRHRRGGVCQWIPYKYSLPHSRGNRCSAVIINIITAHGSNFIVNPWLLQHNRHFDNFHDFP